MDVTMLIEPNSQPTVINREETNMDKQQIKNIVRKRLILPLLALITLQSILIKSWNHFEYHESHEVFAILWFITFSTISIMAMMAEVLTKVLIDINDAKKNSQDI